MLFKVPRTRLSIALAAGTLVAAALPGLASASPGACEGSVGPVVKFVVGVNGTPLGGPYETWGWAHPDDKTANPGQAIQYFCFEKP